ncbi:hypothetical protein AAHE18_20G080300 [Arachis hypogaea]
MLHLQHLPAKERLRRRSAVDAVLRIQQQRWPPSPPSPHSSSFLYRSTLLLCDRCGVALVATLFSFFRRAFSLLVKKIVDISVLKFAYDKCEQIKIYKRLRAQLKQNRFEFDSNSRPIALLCDAILLYFYDSLFFLTLSCN